MDSWKGEKWMHQEGSTQTIAHFQLASKVSIVTSYMWLKMILTFVLSFVVDLK